MTYTTEQIARAIAPYIGCKLIECDKNEGVLLGSMIIGDRLSVFNNCSSNEPYWSNFESINKLLLRPVSDMTGDEIKEACLILIIEPLSEAAGRLLVKEHLNNRRLLTTTPNVYIAFVDYLRSIGVDLPSFHLGGKTLFEAGLATYSKEGGK